MTDIKEGVDIQDVGKKEMASIAFRTNPEQAVPILELKDNGDIFVHGKLIENDKEVVTALKEFLLTADRGAIVPKG